MSVASAIFQSLIPDVTWSRPLERRLTAGCVGFTLLAGVFTAIDQVPVLIAQCAEGAWLPAFGHALFLLIAALLVYGGLVYQITRFHYTRRIQSAGYHKEAPSNTAITVLVPSYREEREVIFQTLMSAVLQEGVKKQVVLLIDNPPFPTHEADALLLAEARALPAEIAALLQPMRQRMRRMETDDSGPSGLAMAFDACGEWFANQAAELLNAGETTPSSRFFAMEILLDRAYTAWEQAAYWKAGPPAPVSTEMAWDRIHSWFNAEVRSFERKQCVNLSHAPNKAMNLNSYIGLMGKSWCRDDAGMLRESESGWHVPSTEWVLTLDADSLLLPSYAQRLLGEVEHVGGERVAVIQTPYSAFPGAQGTLERVAGATTDVQYIIHQGFTAWEGTYWVGANALLRVAALRDLAQSFEERGHVMTRFIQDRTVIEDTESTIDLVEKGWLLWNHPERLAYSATPQDFGSLLIQRRRWANGGLLILPKALAHLAHHRRGLDRVRAGFFRVHYLISIATVNLGLLVLLAFPLTREVQTFWLPLTAVPYFFLYGRDLRLMGYHRGDVFRVYALNMLLIPVNLGGVFTSIQQAITGRQIPFARTPKVANRTPVVPRYLAWTGALIAQWTLAAWWDFHNGFASHGFFAAANALILGYAVFAFIGVRHAFSDLVRRP